LETAFLLDSAWRYFPSGTVHLVVVDPGVGSDRPAIALEAGGHFFVGPDNGVFTYLPEAIGTVVNLPTPGGASATFHGRDLFGPAAARLAGGAGLADLGERRGPPMRMANAWAEQVGEAWRAIVLHVDRFGNVITNVAGRAINQVHSVNQSPVRTVRTYDEAGPCELVVLVGSHGRLEVALRTGSAAERLQVKAGESLLLT
jgi:S-adenosylmethionine hydrolase